MVKSIPHRARQENRITFHMPSDKLLQWRDEFPILARCNYLISNSLGAMPRGVYDSLKYYGDTWAAAGRIGLE